MSHHSSLSLPPDTQVPNHIAIIPDGNRRWARARGLPTLRGHKKGFERAVELARAARQMGIHTASLWGFSTENWDRTPQEINYLMKLYEKLVDDYLQDAKKENIRIIHLGRKDRLPRVLLAKIARAEITTCHNSAHVMNIAIDYGGRDDIIRAAKTIIKAKIPARKIDEALFASYLDTRNQPYPYIDLIIRTSGEQRTSGFLIWQAAYAEYYWESEHFPDFTPQRLKTAILDYSRRRRRFGGNDAVKHLTFKPQLAARLELGWWRLQHIPQDQKFLNYTVKHLKEQYGLSKKLATEAARLMAEALLAGKGENWAKATANLKKFYQLLKGELRLAFEPSLVASLEMKLWQQTEGQEELGLLGGIEEITRRLYAEIYRISTFQAAKVAHLRVLATLEKNLAQKSGQEAHWEKAEDYLEKFYAALKDKVA